MSARTVRPTAAVAASLCRGLLEQAGAELGFSPAECIVVGDKASDIELAHQAGGRGVLVTTGYGAEHLASGAARPDFVAATFQAAADWIASLD